MKCCHKYLNGDDKVRVVSEPLVSGLRCSLPWAHSEDTTDVQKIEVLHVNQTTCMYLVSSKAKGNSTCY